jgi:hypothetical protein
MESGPPKIIETIAGWLIPPASREEVLGDLRQRAAGMLDYIADAARAIPCVIYSRIRRTTDPAIALMQALTLFVSFSMAAVAFDRALLIAPYSFVRLAIPPVVVLAAMIFADAYSDPKKRWPLKPLFAPVLGIALAFAVERGLEDWALPRIVLEWGSGIGALMASSLRLLFPPVADRPQAMQAPAFWQKMELQPIALRYKYELLAAIVVLLVILRFVVRNS